jgi:hypothetical protein
MYQRFPATDSRSTAAQPRKVQKTEDESQLGDIQGLQKLHFFFSLRQYAVLVFVAGVLLGVTYLLDWILGTATSILTVPLFRWAIFLIVMMSALHVLGILTKSVVLVLRRILPFNYYHWSHGWQKTAQILFAVVVYGPAEWFIKDMLNTTQGSNLHDYIHVLLLVLLFNVLKIALFKVFGSPWQSGKLGDQLAEAVYWSWALRRLSVGKYFGIQRGLKGASFSSQRRLDTATDGAVDDLQSKKARLEIAAEVEKYDSVHSEAMNVTSMSASYQPSPRFTGARSVPTDSNASSDGAQILPEKILSDTMRDREESENIVQKIIAACDIGRGGHLSRSVLIDVLGMEAHADRFLEFFEHDEDGISLDSLRAGICTLLEHRRSVSRSLKAQKDASNIVQSLINLMFWILMFFFALGELGVNFLQLIVPITGFFFLVGFGLGPLINNAALALNLCLNRRVFDVGDIISVDDKPPMYVEQIRLWDTFFFRMNGEALYIPNATLANSTIINMKRSHQAVIDLYVNVTIETPQSKIDSFRKAFGDWVAQQPNSLWQNNALVWINTIAAGSDTDQSLQIHLQGFLKVTWQDRSEWQREKNAMFMWTLSCMSELGIEVVRASSKKDHSCKPALDRHV